jgi:hypothetical protein
MPANRPNTFHDLHHQTEREIARTRQACSELEKYLRSARVDWHAEDDRILEAGKRRSNSASRAH